MKTEQAIEVLKSHNRWRRGEEGLEMIDPKKLGIAIDTVIDQFKPSSPIEEEVGMDEAAKKESEDYGHNMKAHIECAFINGAAWHKRQIAKSNTTHPSKEVDRELENYFNKFHFEELGNCYVIDSENFLNFKAYIKGAQKHRNDELKELLEWVRIKTWGFEEPCEDGRAEIPPMELYNKIQSQLK